MLQQQADSDQITLETALETLREGIGTGYGDRITPRANLLRVGQELYPERDFGSLRYPLVEYAIWRYQHGPDKVRETAELAVERTDDSSDDDILAAQEIIDVIKRAGQRRRDETHPYDDSA